MVKDKEILADGERPKIAILASLSFENEEAKSKEASKPKAKPKEK